MQQESQCKIRIATDSDGTPERTCTLSGYQGSIEEAKRLLSDIVKRGLSREGGNNGGYQNNQGGGGGYYNQNNQQGGYRR